MNKLSYKYNRELLQFSKNLRNNMTYEEKKLWYRFLRKNKYKFLRQKIIGKYIIDFYCAKLNLAIEVDGSQHYRAENREYDAIRTDYLNNYGIKVIRVTNKDINQNFIGVCEYIAYVIKRIEMKEGSIE